MNESRVEITTGMCVVALTKHLMKKQKIGLEDAYRKLLGMELYKLLTDPETRLFLKQMNICVQHATKNWMRGKKYCMSILTANAKRFIFLIDTL